MVMLFVVCFMHEHTNCAGRHARIVLPNQCDTCYCFGAEHVNRLTCACMLSHNQANENGDGPLPGQPGYVG